MKKPNLIELAGGAVTATVAGVTADNLADHSVGVLVIVSVVLSMLSSGMWLTGRLAKAETIEVYRCPKQGCTVEIRASRDHSPERLARLRDLAADHGRHEAAGA